LLIYDADNKIILKMQRKVSMKSWIMQENIIIIFVLLRDSQAAMLFGKIFSFYSDFPFSTGND